MADSLTRHGRRTPNRTYVEDCSISREKERSGAPDARRRDEAGRATVGAGTSHPISERRRASDALSRAIVSHQGSHAPLRSTRPRRTAPPRPHRRRARPRGRAACPVIVEWCISMSQAQRCTTRALRRTSEANASAERDVRRPGWRLRRCARGFAPPRSAALLRLRHTGFCPSDGTSRSAISADIMPCVPDVLIRDVPADDLARIDAHAARSGLSRTEYLRRRLHQDAVRHAAPVTVEDLKAFSARFGDLDDPDVMRRAWS